MGEAWKLRGFVIERLLGTGASSEVWRARVAGSGEAVAVKRLTMRDREQAARAQDEAALLTALDHPHLVRLHGVVRDGDALVLVLDLADGGSLAQLLAARGRLTPGEVITALAPLAAALAYLHDESVVHGDVSAANVLFTAAGVPLLADLGVARLTGDDADVESTPAYVDPAVAAGCIPGAASDVFMLAGVALHALTGAPPWPGESAEAALALARAGALDDVPARLARAGAPGAMAAVLLRALDPDPHRRGTAADLALDLRHSGEPVAVELAAGKARVEPRSRGPRHAARPGVLRVDEHARPDFERPTVPAPGEPAQPPTRLVGPRPRPVIPRPAPRRVGPGIAPAAAVLAAVAVLGGLAWWWLSRPDPAARAAHPPTQQVAAPTRAPVAPPATGGRPPPQDWAADLRALDAIRASAYARRDPALLAHVYLAGALLRADTALLTKLVPHGCGLVGARTRYTQVQVTGSGRSATLRVVATLPPSRLVCSGVPAGQAAAVGPAVLRLRLVRTAAGVRIADQQVVPDGT